MRAFARKHGDEAILQVAHNSSHSVKSHANDPPNEIEQKEIKQLFIEILGTDDLASVKAPELLVLLQPDSLLERFAAKKAAKVVHTKDFVNLSAGIKGQLEEIHSDITNSNDKIGFKCLSYSVTESNGHVELTILKIDTTCEYHFGIRTTKGSAIPGKDYEEYDKEHSISKKDLEIKV